MPNRATAMAEAKSATKRPANVNDAQRILVAPNVNDALKVSMVNQMESVVNHVRAQKHNEISQKAAHSNGIGSVAFANLVTSVICANNATSDISDCRTV